jgi:hypothetical protein
VRRRGILIAAVFGIVVLTADCTAEDPATQTISIVVPDGIAGIGLTRLEFATGSVASAGHLLFELPVPNNGAESVTVVFSAPALQAWKAAHGDFSRHSATCGRDDLRGTFTAVPIDRDSDAASGHLTPEILSRIFSDAESVLALMLAEESGISPNRTGSFLYAFHSAIDAADGMMDATADGVPIAMADGLVVPADYQREFLAQAVRRAADAASEKNPVGIRSQDISAILRCISEDDAPNYGPRGNQIDLSGPVASITRPVVPAGVDTVTVNGRAQAVCEVTDDSPIDSISLRAFRGELDITAIALENHQTHLNETITDGRGARYQCHRRRNLADRL